MDERRRAWGLVVGSPGPQHATSFFDRLQIGPYGYWTLRLNNMWEHHHTQIGATDFIFFVDNIIMVPLHNWDIVQVIGRNNHLMWRRLPPWLINTGRDKTLYDPPCTGQLLLRRLTYGTTSPWLSQPSNPLGLIKNMQPPAPEGFALPKKFLTFCWLGP